MFMKNTDTHTHTNTIAVVRTEQNEISNALIKRNEKKSKQQHNKSPECTKQISGIIAP